MNPTLRQALRAQRELRTQLDNLLLGEESDAYEAELKKFVARRPCWVKRNPRARIFTLNSAPFDPTSFLGEGWSIWRGPVKGNGLEGEESQDSRSLTLSEVDVASIRFENMLNEEDGETIVKGEEKILRLKMAKSVRLDARLGRDLFVEPEQSTILRGPRGGRCVLCLYRDGHGWSWGACWLEFDWIRGFPSAVL